MEAVWVLLGVVVLATTLADVFLTALTYDETGFLTGPFSRGLWRVLRTATHRLPRRRRPAVLRQVTGVQVIGVVMLWVVGTITGYGLVYYGLMTRTSFSVASGTGLDLFSAMYFSAAQLATVGGSTLTPDTDLLRLLSVTQTITGVVLVSLSLTSLFGVYGVITDLHALCTRFVSTERGAGSPVATLRPYLRGNGTDALDGHLDAVTDAFGSYIARVRLHQVAYYFQSGRDRFALPYALRMIAGTIAALRWGLPSGHPASSSPRLPALTFQYLEFAQYLQTTVRWRDDAPAPVAVAAVTFERQVRSGPRTAPQDPWVARFVQLEVQLAPLVGADPLADLTDAHRRYTHWLAFAHRADVVTTAVGRDLDYQPVVLPDAPVPLRHEDAGAVGNVASGTTGPRDGGPPAVAAQLPRRLRARMSLLDPGGTRWDAAVRALAGAVVAGLAAAAVARAVGEQDAMRPVIFTSFVAMLTSGAVVGRPAAACLRSGAAVLGVVLVSVLVAAAGSGSHLRTAVTAVVVAAAAAGASRFGPRGARLGTAAFMSCYYGLLMRLRLDDVGLYLAGAALAVGCAVAIAALLQPPRPARALHAGLDAFRRQTVATLEVVEDAVSWGRWDHVLARRLGVAQRRLARGSAFLATLLTARVDEVGVDPRRAEALRLHVFGANLAEAYLVTAVHALPATQTSVELRGRLAGRVDLLGSRLRRSLDPDRGDPGPWPHETAPATWPREARAVHEGVEELRAALDALTLTEQGGPVPAPDDVGTGALPPPAAAAVAEGGLPPATRRAVQAALAVAAGVLVGDALSTTHQYWAMLAAYQVLGGSDAETFVKGTQRVLGTVAGALVGFGVASASGGDPVALVVLVAVGVFGGTYFRGVSTAQQTFFTMMIFSTVYETLGRLTPATIGLRVLETALGAGAALLIAAVVLPTRTRALLDRDLARLVRDLQVVLDAALGRLDGSSAVPFSALEPRLLVIEEDTRRVLGTAAPLRRSGGDQDVGGVEARLTAVWSVAHDVRHLVAVLEEATAAGAHLGGRDWSALRATTADNMAALRAVLEHRPVPAVHEDLGSAGERDSTAPGAEHERAVLRLLDRIDRVLFLLVRDLAPDAVEPVGDPVRAG